MAHALRTSIAQRLADAVQRLSSCNSIPSWMDRVAKVAWCVRFRPVTKRSDVSTPQIGVSFEDLNACRLLGEVPKSQFISLAHDIVRQCKTDETFQGLSVGKYGLLWTVHPEHLCKTVLSSTAQQTDNYGRDSNLYEFIAPCSDSESVSKHITGQTIVIDFSSPNIAKLFHAGHLRSTILGNFISNITTWFGQNVVKVNYLGDWGTQFGLLGIGFKKYGDEERMRSDPMQHLSEIYVKINQESSVDVNVHADAMQYFKLLEQGDPDAVKFWSQCREVSICEYLKMYDRIGISFDNIHGESMYQQSATEFVQEALANGFIVKDSKTGVGYVDLTCGADKVSVRANLVKSDGTTLYLTRDFVAALDRLKTFNADKLYYVVENGQHQHFSQLSRLLARRGHSSDLLKHVKFGRVEGMSTRKGEAVLLRDILDEAKTLALHSLKTKETTKTTGELDLDLVAEQLGTGAILVQDLKEYRENNYQFSWERMLNFRGDTGIFLQYTHARLNTLISKESAALSTVDPVYSLLSEAPAQRLVQHLARFDEALLRSYTELEPCHLVQYLFMIGRLVNVAHDELYVKDQPERIAKTRLVLYESAKIVLANGIRILGLVPMNRL